MTIVGEFSIILTILLISQGIQMYFKLSIPPTIIGMIVLLLSLIFGIIKFHWVEKIADLLIKYLSIMFIPAGVGIINELHFLRGNIIALLFILTLTTVIVMLVTGYTVQYFIRLKKGE